MSVKYELWRQDDNGNKFLVETFNDYAPALVRKMYFEILGHKQLYWIEEKGA